MFVIAAKLRLAAMLYACAAGGSFLVLARKEPKKPLLGLGGLRCGKGRCPCVRTLTELPNDGALGPYVPEISAGGWQPEFGEAHPHRALRCVVRQASACPDAQSAEADEGTRRTHIAGCGGLTQASAANKTRDVGDAVPYRDCLGNGGAPTQQGAVV
ncbi:MAG: hypothetical protein LBO63_04390 [Oscillospiraceae bacterium]|nr:hypothetical protein [Oscillospiraceae bacterium]